jgi:hypothetical protein
MKFASSRVRFTAISLLLCAAPYSLWRRICPLVHELTRG